MKTKQLIRNILNKYIYTRDNDITLYIVYCENVLKKGASEISLMDIFNSVSFNDLAPFHTVERIRRKLQEEDETLRGYLYKKRQEKANKCKIKYKK